MKCASERERTIVLRRGEKGNGQEKIFYSFAASTYIASHTSLLSACWNEAVCDHSTFSVLGYLLRLDTYGEKV